MKKYILVLFSAFLLTACERQIQMEPSRSESMGELTQNSDSNIYSEKSNIVVNFSITENGIMQTDGETFMSLSDISINSEDIKTIYLSEIVLNNSSILSQYENLEYIGFSESTINDFSFLSTLNHIKFFEIQSCDLSGFQEIKNMPNKTELLALELNYSTTKGEPINDISFLKDFHNLERIGLMGNKVSDISVLSECENLRFLRLVDGLTKISTLKPLHNLKYLEHVSISASYELTDDDLKYLGNVNEGGIVEFD